jgi:hypothetical protein
LYENKTVADVVVSVCPVGAVLELQIPVPPAVPL